jgi:hypothetical protein
MKLRILAYHDKKQLYDKGHNFESYIFRIMPPFVPQPFCRKKLDIEKGSVRPSDFRVLSITTYMSFIIGIENKLAQMFVILRLCVMSYLQGQGHTW